MAARLRAVLDTNVVVSALVWGGKPLLLIRAATEGRVLLFTSPVLLAELRDVLTRGRFAARLAGRAQSVEQAIVLYAGLTVVVAPTSTPAVVADDPDDDHVVAAAMEADASVIVSGDRHLLALDGHRGMRIMAPDAALHLVLDG